MKTIKTTTLNEKGYYLWNSFRKHFEGIKEVPEWTSPIYSFTLSKTTTDENIMETVGVMTKEEILSLIVTLTQKQKNKKSGILKMNGYMNIIGYFMCDDGIVRVADVDWFADDGKWRCSVHDLGRWDVGNVVLSRNDTSTISAEPLDTSDTLILAIEQVKAAGYKVIKEF